MFFFIYNLLCLNTSIQNQWRVAKKSIVGNSNLESRDNVPAEHPHEHPFVMNSKLKKYAKKNAEIRILPLELHLEMSRRITVITNFTIKKKKNQKERVA